MISGMPLRHTFRLLFVLTAMSAQAQDAAHGTSADTSGASEGPALPSAKSAPSAQGSSSTAAGSSVLGGSPSDTSTTPNAASAAAPRAAGTGPISPLEQAGGTGGTTALSGGSRMREFLPKIASIEEGRYRLVEIRRKLAKVYSADWLKRVGPDEDREDFVSRLGATLKPADLGFLSLVLTSFGEARGQISDECRVVERGEQTAERRRLCLSDRLARKNLLFVMKIIENRSYSDRFVDYARRRGHPLARLWGVVTQPLRYSSWNPGSPNLGVMMKAVTRATSGKTAGDLKNNEVLVPEDSLALDRALSVYLDYVSPELRFRNFERVIGKRLHRATHMLNWEEMTRLSSVPWTVESALAEREAWRRAHRPPTDDDKRAIFVGLRFKNSEILLPGENEGASRDRLAHVPVYIRTVRNPTVPRLRALKKEQDL